MSKKKIYIDPGHGGESIGASYKGRREQDDVLRLALAVGKLLESQDVEVKFSRTKDINPDLEGRAKEANAWGANYFISIHRNSAGAEQAQGVEAWIYSKCKLDGETYHKAKAIVDAVCDATGFTNRGVKRGTPQNYDDFAVNRVTTMDSCLLEVGFISTTNDNKIFDTKFNEMAEAIARTLCSAVGVNYKKIEKPAENIIYRVQAGAFSVKKNAEDHVAKLKKAGFDAFIVEERIGK